MVCTSKYSTASKNGFRKKFVLYELAGLVSGISRNILSPRLLFFGVLSGYRPFDVGNVMEPGINCLYLIYPILYKGDHRLLTSLVSDN